MSQTCVWFGSKKIYSLFVQNFTLVKPESFDSVQGKILYLIDHKFHLTAMISSITSIDREFF